MLGKTCFFMITDLSDLKRIDTFDTSCALRITAYTRYTAAAQRVDRLLSRVINQPLVTSSFDPPRRDHVLKVKAAKQIAVPQTSFFATEFFFSSML